MGNPHDAPPGPYCTGVVYIKQRNTRSESDSEPDSDSESESESTRRNFELETVNLHIGQISVARGHATSTGCSTSSLSHLLFELKRTPPGGMTVTATPAPAQCVETPD